MHLYLLRHAKSSWDEPHLRDFDRPLNKRGRKAAPIMGAQVKERNIKPSRILCSPSARTRETLQFFMEASELECEVDIIDNIYAASVGELKKIIRNQKKKDKIIMMIGHNPGLEGLVDDLTGEWERFPTAALASIPLDIKDWKDLDRSCGQLEWILRPKELVLD